MSNTATADKKQLERVLSLWKNKSKDGKKVYFSGKTEGGSFLTGFYNTNKKNLKEPDLRVYARDTEGNLSKDPFVSLWANATKNGKQILSGAIDGKKVVGFIKKDATEKQPYISVYWSEELPASEKKEEPKKESTRNAKQKKEEPKFEEVSEEDSLPF